jgi:transposase
MTTSIEAEIIKMHLARCTFDAIASQFSVGPARIARTIREFHQSGIVPEALRIGRPRKSQSELVGFRETPTLLEASISALTLSREIEEHFGSPVSSTTINTIRKSLRFKYRPPRHRQILTPRHMSDRVAFCQKMLSVREVLPRIHFSDESRVVLGDDKCLIWYRAGENNLEASITSKKFPESLMVFAVMGVGFKSDMLFVHGTIDTNQYVQNIDRLEFSSTLDEKHEAFGWIFQQDGASCHTSQVALDWLEESVDLIFDWPANSPDLSPIKLL